MKNITYSSTQIFFHCEVLSLVIKMILKAKIEQENMLHLRIL